MRNLSDGGVQELQNWAAVRQKRNTENRKQESEWIAASDVDGSSLASTIFSLAYQFV
jgi:hypothetical protein